MKVYVVRSQFASVHGVFVSEKQAEELVKSSHQPGVLKVVEFEVQQPPTWTVWAKPNSAEARSAALNEGYRGDCKVTKQLDGGYVVNVSANDIKEAIDVGESAFRMHQISNQQENSK